MKSFASDNYSGIHPEVLNAITRANHEHATGYGSCEYTQKAICKFKEHFGSEIDVFFLFSGTAANVLGIKALTRSYNSVICADTAHINTDECGAPEHLGCKLIPLANKSGKLQKESIKDYLRNLRGIHSTKPKVVSITQPTERGTVYSCDEVLELSKFAHENGLYLHMDGTRLANAAVSLNKNFKDITQAIGVDVLSFGGTKNGMMIGESVMFFNKNLHSDFLYLQKNNLQLYSKMRFIAAQFETYLSNDLWKRNATNANTMAKLLAKKLKNIPGTKITESVDANTVFVLLPPVIVPILQKRYPFYIWDELLSEARFVTSFDTTETEVNDFASCVAEQLRQL